MKKKPSTDVCLVMPPFADDIFPSLALGLLSACLSREGISCRVDYAATHFLRLAGGEISLCLVALYPTFAAEAVFAPLAGFEPRLGLRELAREVESSMGEKYRAGDVLRKLEEARRIAEVWLEETCERILADEPRFVGISSMYLQRNASLAILRRLKEIRPEIVTALGGANCMGSAGGAMLSRFPFVDYVFFGEADEIFADVVRGALSGKPFSLPYGVLKQGDPLPRDGTFPHRLTEHLDDLPFPDYDDFFASRKYALDTALYDYTLLLGESKENVLLAMEGSRGCWWGEKHPCTFCGLNGKMKRHRAKSPERIAEEMNDLFRRYGKHGVCFTDSILSREAQKRLPELMEQFPETAGGNGKPRLFCEIKSNLTEEEVRNLAAIGFVSLQPGIESLSDHVLELMNKGNTAIRHIALLKYARKYHVAITWNLLHGFPGEEIADYEELLRILPLLSHLYPPNGLHPLIYHKNSVYATRPEAYGLELTPAQWYAFFAPDDEEYIADIAYNYEDRKEAERKAPLRPVYDKVSRLVKRWRLLAFGDGLADRLEMRDKGEAIEIMDLRECALRPSHLLTGLAGEIYRRCGAPISRRKLLASLPGQAEQDIEDCLKSLLEKKILIEIHEEYLALAVEAVSR